MSGDGVAYQRRVALARADASKGEAQIVLCQSPSERCAFTRQLQQSCPIGNGALFQRRRVALPPTERKKRIAKVYLGISPIGWDSLASPFLQRGTSGGDGLFEPLRS